MPDKSNAKASTDANGEEGVGLTMVDALASGSARHLFAALMAAADGDAKVIARELGNALGLNTLASAKAESVGSFTATDLDQ
jgi:hypothetical protein